jgi:hypothetical protein
VEQVLPWRHHALTGNRAMATTAVALTQMTLTFVVPLPSVAQKTERGGVLGYLFTCYVD